MDKGLSLCDVRYDQYITELIHLDDDKVFHYLSLDEADAAVACIHQVIISWLEHHKQSNDALNAQFMWWC